MRGSEAEGGEDSGGGVKRGEIVARWRGGVKMTLEGDGKWGEVGEKKG